MRKDPEDPDGADLTVVENEGDSTSPDEPGVLGGGVVGGKRRVTQRNYHLQGLFLVLTVTRISPLSMSLQYPETIQPIIRGGRLRLYLSLSLSRSNGTPAACWMHLD